MTSGTWVSTRTGQTAADLMVTDVPVVAPDVTAGDLLRQVRGRRFDTFAAIAIFEDRRLVGIVDPAALVAAPDDLVIESLSTVTPTTVGRDDDQERVARLAARLTIAVVAVVDARGDLLGLIPPERLARVLAEEHDEDLARLGGFMSGAAEARAVNAAGSAKPWSTKAATTASRTASTVGVSTKAMALPPNPPPVMRAP